MVKKGHNCKQSKLSTLLLKNCAVALRWLFLLKGNYNVLQRDLQKKINLKVKYSDNNSYMLDSNENTNRATIRNYEYHISEKIF